MVNPFEKMCKLLTSSLFFIVLLISFVILLLYHRVEDSDDMDRWKKISRFLSSVLFYSLIVILVIVGLMVGATAVDKFMGKKNNEIRNPLFGAYIIISPSMVPNINVYDAVITMRVSEKYIELYDIITFLSKEIETNGTPITHRVVGIVETEDGEKAYRTKGDANASEDRALIRQREVLGKVLFFDGGKGVALRLKNLLEEKNVISCMNSGFIEFYDSSNIKNNETRFYDLLK